jgi:hypothetical protein
MDGVRSDVDDGNLSHKIIVTTQVFRLKAEGYT